MSVEHLDLVLQLGLDLDLHDFCLPDELILSGAQRGMKHVLGPKASRYISDPLHASGTVLKEVTLIPQYAWASFFRRQFYILQLECQRPKGVSARLYSLKLHFDFPRLWPEYN